MDLATLIGLVGVCIVVGTAIVLGGSVGAFVNAPSLVLVLGGTLLVTLMKFSLHQFLNATKVAIKAFIYRVPEAEDFVRFHRMWASNADQPVFGGNWQWRAFFGLITLFIALPLINASTAKPAWQVLLTGPSLTEQKKRNAAVSAQNRAWFMVTRNAYVEPVHEKAKLPWQERPGQWPQIDPSTLFNF